MTVNFGTSALATAMTSFAPSRAIPPASYSCPTMNPVMFCRKTSGTRRLHASSMKCAPFWDDWAKSTPLFARFRPGDLPRRLGLARVQVPDDLARECEGVLIRVRVVVRHAGLARVHVGPA